MTFDPKAVTSPTGTIGIIKRKQPRLDLINGKARIRAGKSGRKHNPLVIIRMISKNQPITKAKRRFQRVCKTCCQFIRITGDHNPINNNLDIMFFLFIQCWRIVNIIDFAINADPAESPAMQFAKLFSVFTFAAANNWRQQI